MISAGTFGELLRTRHGYETIRVRPPAAARLPGAPGLVYYVRVGLRIAIACGHTPGGGYGMERWFVDAAAMLRTVEAAGGTISIAGLERVAALTGPAVYVANHMSALDVFMLPAILLPFGPLAFVVKRTLLAYPFFGPVIRALRPVTVTRRDARQDFRTVLTDGGRRLESGISVAIFPQATRRDVFVPADFNSLGAKLAGRTGAPLVPVALKTDFHGRGRLLRGLGPIRPERRVYARVGPPLAAAGNEPETHRKSVEFIAGCLREWGAVMPPLPSSAGPSPSGPGV